MTDAIRALVAAAVALLSCAAVFAQDGPHRAEFEKERQRTLAEAAQRHLRCGSWARKQGLVPQATAQFLRAQEVGEGTNPGARTVVELMRSLDDAFWRANRERPGFARLRNFERRVRVCEQRNREDWFRLAVLAHRHELQDDALRYLRLVIAALDEPATREDDGGLRLGKLGKVPAELASRLQTPAAEGDAQQTVLPLVSGVEGIGELHEVRSLELIVQTDVGPEQAARTHALLTKLIPQLEKATGERPARAMRVFVFAKRDGFSAWMAERGYPASTANGLCDYESFVAAVCAEDLARPLVDAVALHELAHLWDHALSPVVFPSWYVEAWAESFGAPGTFEWSEGGELELGGPLPEHRLAPLREPQALLPLRELLRTNGRSLLASDRERALRFYAQSLLFLRYLREHAGAEAAESLRVWEARCRGTAAGAVPGVRRLRDEKSATELFERMFGERLDALETGFREWLAKT